MALGCYTFTSAMTNHIRIIAIILLTIKIIYLKAEQLQPQQREEQHHEKQQQLYGNFTAIEFLKELKHWRPTYDSVLIMKNQNATISSVFYTHLIEVLNGKHNKDGTASNCTTRGLKALSEVATAAFVKSLVNSVQVPVVQLNELQSFYLKRHYHEHFLSIVYIDIKIEGIQMTLNDHKGLLEKLPRNLLHMTTTKVMFLLNFPWVARASGSGTGATIDEDVIESVVLPIFHHCWKHKIINVVALLANYQTTQRFYSYTHFPEFHLEVKKISLNTKQQEIYPSRLKNLNGFKLPAVIGGTDPRIILYQNRDGNEVLGGFVGHFITTFAKKYNCLLELIMPLNPKEIIPAGDLIDSVKNGSAEITSGIYIPDLQLRHFTYPIELTNWCIMVPVEANIPNYEFYTLVFKGKSYLLVVAVTILLSMLLSAALHVHGYAVDLFGMLCHGTCLRGILGQTFSEITNPPCIVRFIYLKICILGILLTTSYTCYFSTFVTHPPKEAVLHSFDDILQSGLKILVWEQEYQLVSHFLQHEEHKSIFKVVKDFQRFLQLRDSFNTKYGYALPNTKWTIVNEQQKLFTTPLFRHSDNFCFLSNIPLCFPVHENSLFRSMINHMILEASQSGLISYWTNFGFFELIAAKKLMLNDLSAKNNFKALTILDLKYVFIFLGGMFIFCNLAFLGELVLFNQRMVLKFLRSRILKRKFRTTKRKQYNTRS